MVFRFLKIFLITIIFVNFFTLSNAKDVPSSFADLAEKLMPSVVNISTTVDCYFKVEGTAATKNGMLLSADGNITIKVSPSDTISAYATGAGQISVTEMSE